MGTKKILLIDDEPSCHRLVLTALGREFGVESVQTLAEAKTKVDDDQYCFIILDIHLPDGNGVEFYENICREVLRAPPVLFLTQQEDIEVKLKTFELGAYDYVVKPFDPRELLARIKAHQIHESLIPKGVQILKLDGVTIDRERNEVRCDQSNMSIALTPIEYRLLLFLADAGGRTLSRDDLITHVWNKSFLGGRTVDRHISSLRSKLKDHEHLVQTVPNVGYRIKKPKTNKKENI